MKEAVLPFHRFRTPEGKGVDPLLGPEMKSTGEVMGFDASFGAAFAKSQAAAYGSLPTSGRVFVSMADRDKRGDDLPGAAAGRARVRGAGHGGHGGGAAPPRARRARRCASTTRVARRIIDVIMAGAVDMIINTPYGNSGPRIDGYEIRSAAVAKGIPCITTVQGAAAAVQGIEAMKAGGIGVRSLQEAHAALKGSAR